MKKLLEDACFNLYIAAFGLLLIVVLMVYYALASVSTAKTTQYIYIDNDDTQDSVAAKIQPFSSSAGFASLNMLFRLTKYSKRIRRGRYAIKPGDGAIAVYCQLWGGQQASISLTIPEVRTMDRLAAYLSHKLMV
ncbi:MAG: aminodeoxychorismate lyase, partial [Prevotella sp.]|nr:aminodeoxychorismate lyase [Prevotella sp.]